MSQPEHSLPSDYSRARKKRKPSSPLPCRSRRKGTANLEEEGGGCLVWCWRILVGGPTLFLLFFSAVGGLAGRGLRRVGSGRVHPYPSFALVARRGRHGCVRVGVGDCVPFGSFFLGHGLPLPLPLSAVISPSLSAISLVVLTFLAQPTYISPLFAK